MRKVDHDSRREEVAAVAAKLIAEQGLENLTTRNLAKAMGCSIGVLSHYFANKQEIVLAAFDWADERIDARIQEAIHSRDASLETFVPIILEGLPVTPESDLEWKVRFNLYTYAFTEPRLRDAQRQKLQQFRSMMEALISTLQKNGEVRRDTDAALITRLAFDLVTGAAHSMLMLPFEKRQESAEQLLGLLDQLRPS